MATLGAGRIFTLVLFEHLTLHMVITETGLATQAGVLPQSVAGSTFVSLCLQDLATGLVLKLVILTQEVVAEGATVYPSPMVPYTAFTLDTVGIHERTCASVGTEALSPVAHPGLTEVTHCPHHAHPRSVDPWVLDDTV